MGVSRRDENFTLNATNGTSPMILYDPHFSSSPPGTIRNDFELFLASSSLSSREEKPSTTIGYNELNLYLNTQFIDIQLKNLDLFQR